MSYSSQGAKSSRIYKRFWKMWGEPNGLFYGAGCARGGNLTVEGGWITDQYDTGPGCQG
jgi:hypothetical protein